MKLSLLGDFFLFAAFSAATSDAWLSNNNHHRASGTCPAGSSTMGPSPATKLSATRTSSVEVIGKGRIGSLFQSESTTFVGRDDPIDPGASGPILVATRNDALDGIVEKCPENRRKDLVFMQVGPTGKFPLMVVTFS